MLIGSGIYILVNIYEVLQATFNVVILTAVLLLYYSVCVYFRTMLKDLQNIFQKIDQTSVKSRRPQNSNFKEAIDFHCEIMR